MTLSHPKNLEALTQASESISKTLNRLGFIRATIVTLIAFALAAALEQISSSAANAIVTELANLAEITKESPELPDIFLKAIYEPKFQDRARPDQEEGPATASNQPASQRPPPSDDEIARARGRTTELIGKLKAITDASFVFSFRAPLLGTDVKLDLRVWGFLLPVGIILSEIYFWVLRYKRAILYDIGSLLVRSHPEDATVVDSLRFVDANQSKPAFSRHPSQLELSFTVIGGLALFIYVGRAGATFWAGWDAFSRFVLVSFYGILIVYAIAYVAYVKRQLDRQIALVEGLKSRRSALLGLRLRFTSFAARTPGKLRPRMRLSTAAVMVLTTLWLLVAAPLGCQPKTGLQYLKEPDGWLVGPISGIGALTKLNNHLIAILYGTGLILAAATLLIVFGSVILRRSLSSNRLIAVLASLTTVVFLFFVSELSFGHILDLTDSLDPLSSMMLWLVIFILWPIPICLWLWFANTRKPSWREAWPAMQVSLWRWYQPQLVVAAMVTVETFFNTYKLIGVPIFVAGMGLLANSYQAIANPEEPVPSSERPGL